MNTNYLGDRRITALKLQDLVSKNTNNFDMVLIVATSARDKLISLDGE